MSALFVIVGALPVTLAVWIIATRHRRGLLRAASQLVTYGAVILALEHAGFALTCSAQVFCPVRNSFFSGDHVRLHFFMAGVYTVIAAVVLTVVARTLLQEGRRIAWFVVLGALVVGGTLDLILANVWFDHGFPGDTTAAAQLIDDFGWTFIYTYLFAWSAALVISYRPVFSSRRGERSTEPPIEH